MSALTPGISDKQRELSAIASAMRRRGGWLLWWWTVSNPTPSHSTTIEGRCQHRVTGSQFSKAMIRRLKADDRSVINRTDVADTGGLRDDRCRRHTQPLPTSSAVQFYYPTKASPTFWIELKAPEFGNQEGIDKRQVIDISAAGEQIVYTRGPKTYTISLAFAQLGRAERDAIGRSSTHTRTVRNTFQYRQPRYDMLRRMGRSVSQRSTPDASLRLGR